MKHVKLYEQYLNEAKSLDRDEMIKWIEQFADRVRPSEEFNGNEGGIWVCGECGYEYKGKLMYWNHTREKAYELGVLKAWEKELNKRGWWSEWHDAGTVMIWPN